jgi:hypothetical protein
VSRATAYDLTTWKEKETKMMVRDSLTKKSNSETKRMPASASWTRVDAAERRTQTADKKENDIIKDLTSFPPPSPTLAIAGEPRMAIPMRPSFEIKNNLFMFGCCCFCIRSFLMLKPDFGFRHPSSTPRFKK